ncbi:MAG: DUF2089 domain-containing protein [Ruminococcaceae bacterium]|nr:DUF2089 domain-containing protein [Oscillospiraceae bacterium]
MSNKGTMSWLDSLDTEEICFVKKFVLASGSLKKLGALYDVSYPTIRLRLDKLIQKIRLNDNSPDEPYINFVKTLAIDDKIDADVAKLLIEEYKKDKEARKEEL